ncbi:MAG: GNAT family N-acetyltransferase [Candidatus Pacebacteria bacterium]|nr:GNAT family N-acetyltransferase [Candidatus Paceibacterota bacterium]
MRRFKSEFAHSYKTYSFGYCEYAEVEHDDVFADVYAEGFLPYSGSKNVKRTCYLARSARVRLPDFSLSSENRRIAKQFDGQFIKRSIPIEEFDTTDTKFLTFCADYFLKRHGEGVLPEERLRTILNAEFITHVDVYETPEGQTIAYVLMVNDARMSHFWFSFYDLAYAYKSLGMWLMLDAVRVAKEEGKEYFYVGTVYGEKALYKTNFDTLEFFDGNVWSRDIKLLKSLSRNDVHHVHDGMDRWKETHEHF